MTDGPENPLLEGLARLLSRAGVGGAHLRVGRSTWRLEAAGRFVPADAADPLPGPRLALPGGTLSLAAPLAPEDSAAVETLARAAAEAIQLRDRLDTVFKTGLALSANLNLKNVLSELLVLTQETLDTEAGSVMLLDETKTKLYWEVAGGGGSGALESRTLPVGEGIAGTVARTGEPIIVSDAERDRRVARWVDEVTSFRTRSILCVPIRFKGGIIGVLQALNKREGTFDEDDRELLELIAAEAGVAIENARLYESLEARVRERTRELSDANAHLSRTLDELREAQTQLIQAEKMASLGRLVAGVAHEINTPLGAIASNTDLLARGFTKLQGAAAEAQARLLKTLTPLVETNAQACRRISEIVKNLRIFARLDEAEWKSVDLRQGMDSTLTLVHHLHKGRVQIAREYGEIPLVECHPGQINQVFMNLLVNAVQAIEGPGTIRIRMSAEEGRVLVEVQDSGCGIDEAHLGKIFDPGFTTKGVGVGTGLGLSICHQIVAAHKGSIHVTSRKGMGATFTVTLPVRPGA
jgi:signal transduction histidine kinase